MRTSLLTHPFVTRKEPICGATQHPDIIADPDSLKVAALGPLNPATRAPGANAGRAQGLRIAHEVREAF